MTTNAPDGLTDQAAAIREVRDLAYQATSREPVELADGVGLHLRPYGHDLVVTDVRAPDDWAEHPLRRRGTATFDELEPFTRYVNTHHTDTSAATTVWTHHEAGALGKDDRPIGTITGILDDHDGVNGTAGWGEHRATLALRTTPEWRHWLSLDAKRVDQLALAEHLEDGIAEVIEPAAADLLDVVQTISVNRDVEFASSQRTTDGQIQFAYKEQQDAKAGNRGNLTIPERFKLAVAVFPGGDRVPLTARLRYRVSAGGLEIGYKLERPQDAVREAVEKLHADLLSKLDGGIAERVYRGAPIGSDRSVRRDEQLKVRAYDVRG
ncbi:hypothetical protein PAI11_37810 [Patulibacter medicamentivorans]|uniref:DUF2303 family protein n=1 Tax=Patulibacter medicamentivorans TaxID=1097667 RepID=H0EAA7_9ACTN|nr:DUF2303 family protein [Patulibacter medicamentivorans]EHN09447.1 hypothetical protein PAI11_37810 [Patulibacter medicamentivorans]